MFDFEPLYLNISSNASDWGQTNSNDGVNTSYSVYSRGIIYALDSFSEKWNVGYFYYKDGKRNYGKLNGKTYSWYSERGGTYQFNQKDSVYYWFCLER